MDGKGEGGGGREGERMEREREGGRKGEREIRNKHRNNGAAQTTHAQFDFRIPHVRRGPPTYKNCSGCVRDSVWLLLSLLLPVCRISLR